MSIRQWFLAAALAALMGGCDDVVRPAADGTTASLAVAPAPPVRIHSFAVTAGTYAAGAPVAMTLQLRNTGTARGTFWWRVSACDAAGACYNLPSSSITLSAGAYSPTLRATWSVPRILRLTTGPYTAVATVWSGAPERGGKLLVQATRTDAFQAQLVNEPFSRLDESLWWRGDEKIPADRGTSRRANTSVSNGSLVLKTPRGTLDGGVLASGQGWGYGVYEASIECPRAPGLLCAFFLMNQRYRDEIDVEIYGQNGNRADFVLHILGKPVCRVPDVLPFDPRSGPNVYRIEFLPSGVRIFADGKLRATFPASRCGAVREPVLTIFKTWWPSWHLQPGGAPFPPLATDVHARVDWFRH